MLRTKILNRLIQRYCRTVCSIAAVPEGKLLPLITCRNTQFNLYLKNGERVDNSGKSLALAEDEITLASKGWQHYKAKGDNFTIHPTRKVSQSNLQESTEIESLDIDERIARNAKEKHDITRATKVQVEAFDSIIRKHHTIIAAETGCGKTHAYLMPIIQQLIYEKRHQPERQFNTPLALILTPGRELAHQIGKVAEELTEGCDINVKVVIGGKTKQKMLNPSFEDVDILIGSIGALSKLTTTGIYRTTEVKHVVLDEADTLLDDGFSDKLCHFLSRFPFHKGPLGAQLILASATMPNNTDETFQSIIDTTTLNKVVSDDLHKILPYVTQKFLRINKSDRPANLIKLVKAEVQKRRPVIVFSNKSATSDYISMFLNDNGVNCLNLNGDMLVQIREGRFERFQSGDVNVLSTTDCIGRGLNTVRARHIINFDFPLYISDYIHRCGRIGRLGSSENCYITNFVSSLRELDIVRDIERSARTNWQLKDVNANIRNIITSRIEKEIQRHEKMM